MNDDATDGRTVEGSSSGLCVGIERTLAEVLECFSTNSKNKPEYQETNTRQFSRGVSLGISRDNYGSTYPGNNFSVLFIE